jgi:molecular chaperone DnaK
VLTYDPHPPEMERLLVYDLGGGTFDVSIAQVEQGVVEILASHGDTQLGGDDFDQRLLDFVCDAFQTKHGIDLRQSLTTRSRLLSAVEEVKKRLSVEPVVTIDEAFLAEKDGVPLNLSLEVSREDYERLIEPLLAKTLKCVDDALRDANVPANLIDKVVLVGGATRTPLVHRLLTTRLGRPVHAEVNPDLAVALGAAVQGGLIAGIDVGPILVDITPHTLGIESLGEHSGLSSPHCFSPIIERNTPLPAVRTEIYSTVVDGQDAAEIRVFQGEDDDTRLNQLVGQFKIQGLAPVAYPNQILVRLDLDLNGILRVTAIERATGLAKEVVIDNMMERFRQRGRVNALERIESLFGSSQTFEFDPLDDEESLDETEVPIEAAIYDPELRDALGAARALLDPVSRVAPDAAAEDAAELRALAADLQLAVDRRSLDGIRKASKEIEEIVFYLEDR